MKISINNSFEISKVFMKKCLLMIITALSIPILTAADTVYPQGNFKDDLVRRPLPVELYPTTPAAKSSSVNAMQRVIIKNKTSFPLSGSVIYPSAQQKFSQPLMIANVQAEPTIWNIPLATWRDSNGISHQEPASVITINARHKAAVTKNISPDNNELTVTLENGKLVVQ